LRVEMGTIDGYYPTFAKLVIALVILVLLDNKFACSPPSLVDCLDQIIERTELGDFIAVRNDNDVGLSHGSDGCVTYL